MLKYNFTRSFVLGENWSLVVSEELRLKVFQKRALMITGVPEGGLH
jgi:hypothetical protein